MPENSTKTLARPRFKDVPEHWKHPEGPYRQAPEEHGGEWWLVNPFTGAAPWLFEENVRRRPPLPEGFLEIFGPRPTIAQFQGTPKAYFAYRSALVLWEQELRYFKQAGFPDWAAPEQIVEAERIYQAWGLGRPRYYEGRYSWMARFVESPIKDYDVPAWTALNWTHGSIAHFQIALADRGILPEKKHPPSTTAHLETRVRNRKGGDLMSPKTGRVVIASGQNESSVLELISETIVGLYMPTAWDAADLVFSASQDGTNFSDMYDFGSPLAVPANADQYVPLDFSKFVGVAYLKFKSELGGSSVNQTAERVITPVFRVLE